MIKTRALSAAAPAQSWFSSATRVKFKRVSLMSFPSGTVIVVGKIGAGNVTTSSSNGFPRRIGRTVGKQLLQFIQTVRNIFLNVHLSLISSDSL